MDKCCYQQSYHALLLAGSQVGRYRQAEASKALVGAYPWVAAFGSLGPADVAGHLEEALASGLFDCAGAGCHHGYLGNCRVHRLFRDCCRANCCCGSHLDHGLPDSIVGAAADRRLTIQGLEVA